MKNRIIISASIAVCAFMLLLSVNRFFTFYGFSVSGKCQYESKDGRIITSENFTKSDLNRIVKILNFHIIDYGVPGDGPLDGTAIILEPGNHILGISRYKSDTVTIGDEEKYIEIGGDNMKELERILVKYGIRFY